MQQQEATRSVCCCCCCLVREGGGEEKKVRKVGGDEGVGEGSLAWCSLRLKVGLVGLGGRRRVERGPRAFGALAMESPTETLAQREMLARYRRVLYIILTSECGVE